MAQWVNWDQAPIDPFFRGNGAAVNYATIKYCDIANGEGVRTSLFVSGCRRHCPYCFNEVAWDFAAGMPFSPAVEDEVLASLEPAYIAGLSVLGGEPMEPENQRGLVGFLERVRAVYPADGAGAAPAKTIWCYTGDTLDELMPGGRHRTEVTERLLACIDVLVDGPYVQELHDVALRFRGSSNQRVIDLAATHAAAAAAGCTPAQAVRLWDDGPFYSTHSM